jgi:hypothetical protein
MQKARAVQAVCAVTRDCVLQSVSDVVSRAMVFSLY